MSLNSDDTPYNSFLSPRSLRHSAGRFLRLGVNRHNQVITAASPRRNKSLATLIFGNYKYVYLILFVIVALHTTVAMTVSVRTPEEFLRPSLFITLISFGVVPALVFFVYVALRFTIRRTSQPSKAIYRVMMRHRYWIFRSCLLFAMSWPSHQAFIALKVAIPRLVPYYADPIFADLDNLIFFGTEPWKLTHALFGEFTVLIDTIYYQWFTVVTWLHIWASFSRDAYFQIRATLAHLLTWLVLGNIFATLLSSVGPIFYEHFYGDDRFSPLLGKLDPDLMTMSARTFLVGNFGNESFGSGISAAPSLHVAMTVLIYMMIRDRFGSKHWLSFVAISYVAIIFVGSIHLAWHYAIDGLISLAVVPIIYRFAGRLTDRFSSSDLPDTSGSAS